MIEAAESIALNTDVAVVPALGAECLFDAGRHFNGGPSPDPIIAVVEQVVADHTVPHSGLLEPEPRIAFKQKGCTWDIEDVVSPKQDIPPSGRKAHSAQTAASIPWQCFACRNYETKQLGLVKRQTRIRSRQ